MLINLLGIILFAVIYLKGVDYSGFTEEARDRATVRERGKYS